MKRITVAVCLDDENGMMFGGRRQSRDRILIEDFVRECSDRPICVGEYSRILFAEYPQVQITSNPLGDCPNGGVCFAEDQRLTPHLNEIEALILYRWNRLYPSDLRFDVDLRASGFSLVSSEEFEGSSHPKITKEIYRK
jgi:hypothetical protein